MFFGKDIRLNVNFHYSGISFTKSVLKNVVIVVVDISSILTNQKERESHIITCISFTAKDTDTGVMDHVGSNMTQRFNEENYSDKRPSGHAFILQYGFLHGLKYNTRSVYPHKQKLSKYQQI